MIWAVKYLAVSCALMETFSKACLSLVFRKKNSADLEVVLVGKINPVMLFLIKSRVAPQSEEKTIKPSDWASMIVRGIPSHEDALI